MEKARTARDHFMASRLDIAVAEIERAEAEHMEKSIGNFRRLGYTEIPANLDNKAEYEKICLNIYENLDRCETFLRDWCRLIEVGVESPIAILKNGRRVCINEMHKNDVLGILAEIEKEQQNGKSSN